jgi:hypothetical protein
MEDDNRLYLTLNKTSSFIEYFYTIGLDSNLILQNYLYITDLSTLNETKAVKPDIITKFPNTNKFKIDIDDETLIKVRFLTSALLSEWLFHC